MRKLPGPTRASLVVSSLSLAVLCAASACVLDFGGDAGDDEVGDSGESGSEGESAGDTANGDCELVTQAEVDVDLTLGAGCYRVDDLLSLETSTLTLEPGAILYFGEYAGFAVANGVLVSKGSAESPVELRAANGESGGWAGLYFLGASSSSNLVEHTLLTQGGIGGSPALSVEWGSRVSVRNSTFSDNAGRAILGSSDSQLSVSGTSFVDNVAVGAVGLGSVAGFAADNSFTGNDLEVLELVGSVLNEDATWVELGIPARFLNTTVDIEADWILEPGVDLEMPQDMMLRVGSEGTIHAEGSAGAPVWLRGVQDEVGYWRGLSVDSKSSANLLAHVELRNGGSDRWNGNSDSIGAIWLTSNGKLEVRDSSLSASGWYALIATPGADIEGFAGNDIHDNVRALNVSGDAASQVEASNSFSANSDENVVRVGLNSETKVNLSGEWAALEVPFFLSNRLRINNDLSLAAGAHVQVAQDVEILVAPEASLGAAGTAGDQVIIEGREDIAGYWRGINYASTSADNLLSYTQLRNAGSDEWAGPDSKASLYIGKLSHDGSATLSNVTLGNSDGYAVLIREGSSISCSSTTFEDVEKPSVSGPGICN